MEPNSQGSYISADPFKTRSLVLVRLRPLACQDLASLAAFLASFGCVGCRETML